VKSQVATAHGGRNPTDAGWGAIATARRDRTCLRKLKK